MPQHVGSKDVKSSSLTFLQPFNHCSNSLTRCIPQDNGFQDPCSSSAPSHGDVIILRHPGHVFDYVEKDNKVAIIGRKQRVKTFQDEEV